MLSHMSGFLPVGDAPHGAIHRAQRTNAQNPLIGKKGQDRNNGLMPPPLAPVGLEKFTQPCQVDEQPQDKTVEWQKGQHG